MASNEELRHRQNGSDSPQDHTQDNDHKVEGYRNAREYAKALRPWLCWYHQTNAMNSFSMNMMMMQMQSFSYLSSCVYPYPSSASVFTEAPTDQLRQTIHGPNSSQRPPNVPNRQAESHHAPPDIQNQQGANQGVLMKIPSFWKRVAAELIDFTFLFYIKMLISISLVSEFNLDYLSFVNGEDILETLNDLDYDRAFAITFEVIALEIINRVLITIFETMCLCRARARGRPTGATPGKRLMGLRVVSCDSIRPVDNGKVMVTPAGTVSVKSAFLRSVVKNFTIAFFLPACLTLFFFKHNRAAYDVIAHTVVVEEVA